MKVLKSTFAILASIALFTSCSNDKEELIKTGVKVEKTFLVETSFDSNTTRAHVNNYNNPSTTNESFGVWWDEGDKIKIFTQGNSQGDVFTRKSSSGNQAYFSGKTYETSGYWGIYPAQDNAKLESDGQLTFTIPSLQVATKNSFDPDAGVQIGYLNGVWKDEHTKLGLSHVCAYFALTVHRDCSRIVIEATKSGWYLAGTVTANPKSAGNPIDNTKFGSDCTNTIELTGIPADGGTFLVAFIPTNGLAGVQASVYYGQDTGGPTVKEIPDNTTIQCQAAHIYDWGVF